MEQKGLEEGNTYTFATEFINAYPDLAKANDFDEFKALNRYKAYVDYNDGIFTFWGNDGIKYFFDTQMRFRGTKM